MKNRLPKYIGISGGSGAGKSTLATALLDAYPDHIGLIQLDDYFKPTIDVPVFAGVANWDHPDALYIDRLVQDLRMLAEGKSVIIQTKNERLNPDYKKTDKRIPVEFMPKPIMLVEGYLVLYDKRVRDLLHTSIWLDLSQETRWQRRVHFKNDEYLQNVLIPMHERYAEPTKAFAEHVIDVTERTKDDVFEQAKEILNV